MIERFVSQIFRLVRWFRTKHLGMQLIFMGMLILTSFASQLIPVPGIRLTVLIPLMTITIMVVSAWFVFYVLDWRQDFIIRQTDTLDRIRSLNWRDFEILVGAIYGHLGYYIDPFGGDQPDGGIDHIVCKDGKRTIIQCKHWKGEDVGIRIVRELLGAMVASGVESAILITSVGFTADAKAFAQGKSIELIDDVGVYRLLQQVQLEKDRIPDPIKANLDRLMEGMFLVEGQQIHRCPLCGAEMTPKFNNRESKWFWGCSRFQGGQCRGNRSLGPAERKLIETIQKK